MLDLSLCPCCLLRVLPAGVECDKIIRLDAAKLQKQDPDPFMLISEDFKHQPLTHSILRVFVLFSTSHNNISITVI